MSSNNHQGDYEFQDWARRLPRPVPCEAAQERSLDAAMAVLVETSCLSTGSKRRALPRLQIVGLAACWLVIAGLKLNSPSSPEMPGFASSHGGYQGSYSKDPPRVMIVANRSHLKTESEELLAKLYLTPSLFRSH